MGKKRSSKNKKHSDTVATNVNKEATNVNKEATNGSVSDRIRDEGHERKRTALDKNATTIGPASEGASQSEANSKCSYDEGASQADEQCKDLQFYKNKLKALEANLKATERKCDKMDSVIKEKEKKIHILKTENLELCKTIEDLQAKYEIEVEKKLYSVPDSETCPMDVDTSQVDIREQQNGRGRDIHPQTLQKQNESNTSWDVGEPSTSWDVQHPSTSWDLQQPCTSSHNEHWDEGKQHTRRGSQLDIREKRPHFAEHKQHNLDYGQSRTQQNRNELTHNQNCKGWLIPKRGGLKVEPPAVYKIVTEVTGDLFEAPKDNSLAHCVAEDLRMGSGIAIRFRQEFKRVDELLDQKKKQGNVAVLQDTERYIYYLITKRVSTGKPTMDTFHRSLLAMREHVIAHNVSKIAMPRIGCGRDKLDWNKVKPLIEDIFSGLNVAVTVYNYNEVHGKSKPINLIISHNAKENNTPVNKKNSSRRKRKGGKK